MAAKSALAADTLTLFPLVMLIILAATTFSLVLGHAPMDAAFLMCWAAVVYVSLLCLDLIVSPFSLGTRLRRASGNPYVKAISLAFVTALILCLGYADLIARGFPDITDVATSFKGLYSQWDSVKAVLSGGRVKSLEIMEGVSGVVLFSAVINGLWSLGDFARTDEDFLAIASNKLRLGLAADAIAALDRIKAPNAASLSCRAAALVAVNQTDQAIATWRQSQSLGSVKEPPPPESTMRNMFELFLLYPMPLSCVLEVFKRLLALNPSERSLLLVNRCVMGLDPQYTNEILKLLSDSNLSDTYPLVLADLITFPPPGKTTIADERLKTASDVIKNVPKTGTVLDSIRAEVLLRIAIFGQTSSEEDRKRFEAWCNEELPSLTQTLAGLSEYDDLVVGLGMINGISQLAALYESAHLQELKYLATKATDHLRKSAPDKEAAETLIRHFMPNLAESKI
jgi:hypothetical protein